MNDWDLRYRLVGRLQQVSRDTTQLDDGRTIHSVSIQLQQLSPALASMPLHAFTTFDLCQGAAAIAMAADMGRLQGLLVEVYGSGITATSGMVPVMFGLSAWAPLGDDAELHCAAVVAAAAIGQAASTSRTTGH
jgi:hypothetical protein